MKKPKKILMSIIIYLSIILLSCPIFAVSAIDGEIEFSESYLEYLGLNEDDKQNTTVPRMYDIPESNTEIVNPFKLVSLLGSSSTPKFSLKKYIPENVAVRNQLPTDTCWAFASIASLESHLGFQDFKFGNSKVIYDFSERHMDYATSRVFLNDEINEYGFNRTAGSVGTVGMATAYLTNGLGAISEEEMKFDDDLNMINLGDIQGKKVITQVNDIVSFPAYTATDDTTKIRQQMKEHIMNYGAIDASIHGFGLLSTESSVFNSETSAAYCNSTAYSIDHAVSIIGWDDDFPLENFVEGNRPSQDGAWIAKNSWGEGFGEGGFYYISYEDANVYRQLTGIENAQTEITYENLYQHDEFGGFLKYKINGTSKMYFATEFDKKTEGKEYLTQISINAPETYTCKVYVNPNGTSRLMKDLVPVELETGETETFEAGYHTIEFLNPIKINSDSFVVVLEVQGTQTDSITAMIEMNYGGFYTDPKYQYAANHIYDNVTIADEKCFIATEDEFNNNEWRITSKLNTTSEGRLPNFDTTIKAFTTSKVLESIAITTPASTTTFIEGKDFEPTGMVVKGYLANGDIVDITNYTILNGENLTLDQTSVTISYNGFTTTQSIEVVENTVEKLLIKTLPQNTVYWAGDDFDATGLEIEAEYKDGTRKVITDYKIEDGQTLENSQTTVTIEYEGKTVTVDIIVNQNSLIKIEITQVPNKVNYVARQNFDSTGIVVTATYANGNSKVITDFEVSDGNDLYAGQTAVTIKYEEQTALQAITVIEKAVTGISIKAMPTKTEYIQTKEELDLTGGIIEISYNDGLTEEMLMTSDSVNVTGFNNEIVGNQIITLTYEGQTAQIEVEIIELLKPENSILDDVQGNVTGIKAYYFSDKNQKEYVVLNVEISNIIKSTENEKTEYYYYLSPNPNEENITGWVPIDEIQELDGKLMFEINSLNITNYEELVNSNKIHLYVKEVATRNNMTVEVVTDSLALDVENINIEKFVDGEKMADVNSDTIIDSIPAEKEDNTTVPGIIPNAGKNIVMIFFTLVFSIIGRVAYLKYKDIKIK